MDTTHGFITVKFGENEEALFNPWCPVFILTDAIRKRCNCDKDDALDLVDLQGDMINLRSKSGEYANTLVADRETYVLIKVEKSPDGPVVKYTSLLHDLQEHYPDLVEKLNNYGSRPTTQHSNRSKKTSKWSGMKGKMSGAKSPRKGRMSAEPQ